VAKLTGKLGEWDLEYVHMWKDREARISAAHRPMVSPETRVATIGSCFAEELAASLKRSGQNGRMHPGGLYYNSRSIRQEFERIAGRWPEYEEIDLWNTRSGYVHPLKNYRAVYPDPESLRDACGELDRAASELFTNADVIVVTLGLIEAWLDPKTGTAFRQIPHPDVFSSELARFHRQSVDEIEGDLAAILEIVKSWGAQLIVTVSPIPLHSTMTPLDVRIANTESKSRIRAAVSQFAERYAEVGYFHSYEIVTTAEEASDVWMEDGRHVERRAVDHIIGEFLHCFGTEEVRGEREELAWLTAPKRTAARPRTPPARRLRGFVSRLVRSFR